MFQRKIHWLRRGTKKEILTLRPLELPDNQRTLHLCKSIFSDEISLKKISDSIPTARQSSLSPSIQLGLSYGEEDPSPNPGYENAAF